MVSILVPGYAVLLRVRRGKAMFGMLKKTLNAEG
jgi:hypothetical protein